MREQTTLNTRVIIDFNNRFERRLYFFELGRFCRRQKGLEALQRLWRQDRARLQLIAKGR